MTPNRDMRPESTDAVFRTLFNEHAGTIYALGTRMCPTATDAEDLVQETFLRAYKSWDQFEGRSKPSTWLWTIAVRACQRMTRKKSHEPDLIEPLENLLPSPGDDIPDVDSGTVLDDIVREEVQHATEQAIGDLPESFRMALVLKDIAGLTLAEIASILGVKEATVKTRVHRARLMLRNALAEALPQQRTNNSKPPSHVCLDLLRSKQEALDNHVPFNVSDAELCVRCRSMFAALDLARDACANIRTGKLPESVEKMLRERFEPGSS